MQIHRIREIAEELIQLERFIKDAGYLNIRLTGNCISLPVPKELMKKWYKDLQLYYDDLEKELTDATK